MLTKVPVTSDEQQIVDWVNFPERVPTLSLWDALQDGDLLVVESDLLARIEILRFDVGYVRDFHHLPEQTQFTIIVRGVQSARSVRNIPWPGGYSIPAEVPNAQRDIAIAEYHSKWREESQSWAEFERLTDKGLEVSTATLGRGSDAAALRLGLLVAGESYVEACIRGAEITFYVGERQATPEEFVALGEAYWDAFAKGRQRD